MISSYTRAIGISTGWCRRLAQWFGARRHARLDLGAGRNSRRGPAGSGMFGLLVSNDAPRGRKF